MGTPKRKPAGDDDIAKRYGLGAAEDADVAAKYGLEDAEPEPQFEKPEQVDAPDFVTYEPGPPREPTSKPEAFGRGAADTASFSLSDEAAGVGAHLADLEDKTRGNRPLREPVQPPIRQFAPTAAPAAAPGSYRSMQRQWAGDDAQALADRPGYFRGGQVAGAVGTAAAPLGPGAQAANAGRLTRLAAMSLGGGLAGGIQARGASDAEYDNNPVALNMDTAVGTGAGAVAAPVLGEVGGKVAGEVSKLGRKAAEALRRKANLNRVAGTGMYGAQLRNFASNRGEEAVQRLGEDIERKGLHRGKGLGALFPQPPETYAENATALMDRSKANMAQAEDAIARAGDPPVQVGDIDADLRANADQMGKRFDRRAGQQQASFQRDIADAIDEAGRPEAPSNSGGARGTDAEGATTYSDAVVEGPSSGKVPFSRALEERRYLDDQIDWNRKGGYEGAGMQEQVRRGVAGDMRAAIREGLDEAVARKEITPELAAMWRESMEDYATGAAVHDPAIARVHQEYGNQKIGLPGYLAAAAGAAAGDVGGAVTGGILGQLVKHRGASALAGTQRAGQRVLSGVAKGLEGAAGATPVAQRARGVLGGRAAPTIAAPAYAQAQQRMGAPSDAAESGLDDPEYGPLLRSKQGQDRATAYAHLSATDPEFRARQRERAKQLQEQQSTETR